LCRDFEAAKVRRQEDNTAALCEGVLDDGITVPLDMMKDRCIPRTKPDQRQLRHQAPCLAYRGEYLVSPNPGLNNVRGEMPSIRRRRCVGEPAEQVTDPVENPKWAL
jgi:hypothetical protein